MPQLKLFFWLNQLITASMVIFVFYMFLVLCFLPNIYRIMKGRTSLMKWQNKLSNIWPIMEERNALMINLMNYKNQLRNILFDCLLPLFETLLKIIWYKVKANKFIIFKVLVTYVLLKYNLVPFLPQLFATAVVCDNNESEEKIASIRIVFKAIAFNVDVFANGSWALRPDPTLAAKGLTDEQRDFMDHWFLILRVLYEVAKVLYSFYDSWEDGPTPLPRRPQPRSNFPAHPEGFDPFFFHPAAGRRYNAGGSVDNPGENQDLNMDRDFNPADIGGMADNNEGQNINNIDENHGGADN